MAILRTPNVGEIVVVPLAHPNGAYIRLDGDIKVPVLAKVRSKFGEMVNIINFFGYIYNVPISHVELINPVLDTQYYVNIINNAQTIMQRFGYQTLNNSEFYSTSPGLSYTFFSYLPGHNNYTIYSPPVSSPKQIIVNVKPEERSEELFYDNSISLLKLDDSTLLHVINRTNNEIIFNSNTGELNIKGYGVFIADTSYTYVRKKDTTEHVIFRSNRNFIHIKKSKIMYSQIKITTKDTLARYFIKIVKLKKTNVANQKRYLDIIEIIRNEF